MNKTTVLITGASRGIGAATAIAFAKSGYDLVLTCKNNIEKLNEIAAQTERYGAKTYTFQGDLCQPETVEVQLKEFLNENKINIGILVNNAGISHIGLLQDMRYAEWRRVIDTNLTSMFLLSKLVIPDMVSNQKGAIINVSSMWGNAGASCEVAYSASKGGVNSFTKALAKELAPSKITVNAIAFGVIDTEMNSFLSAEEVESLVNDIPAGRMGTVKEAAELILQTADAPSYMTGQIITMDGGYL